MSGSQECAALLRHGTLAAQKSPEPLADRECQPSSTPRPRFKLKRRHDPQHLAAPTQHFLASVASADVPMPSIEEPAIADLESEAMTPWGNLSRIQGNHDVDSALHLQFGRQPAFTPPKTPAPGDPPSLTPSRFPSWSVDWMTSCESSPEPESRPSTARSTRTSRSSFSQLSSCFSDDDIHFSPEIHAAEKPSYFATADGHENKLPPNGISRLPRKAPWTKAMSAHLWATYNMYLSDPRVTPFQIGKSGLPPEGVCKRVAGEAIRSWKGSRAVSKSESASDSKSGSSTPTALSSGVFIEWPHTGAATRAHLRALCKQKARGPDGGKMRFSYFSRSPTPFTSATTRWARRSTPGAAVPPFETHEMSKSLALSTAESMRPEGPLALLTNSAPHSPFPTIERSMRDMSPPAVASEPSPEERRRLGSPIHAKGHVPSPSSSFMDVFGLPTSSGERRRHTVGPRRRLQSPVRLSRSSTQKRKTVQSHEIRKRPGLSIDTWLDPSMAQDAGHRLSHQKSFSMGHNEDNIFTSWAQPQLFVDTTQANTQQAGIPIAIPPRLGSPLPLTGSSSSVPNRFSAPSDLQGAILARRYSTVNPSLGSQHDEPASINLASRLAYIDQRLKTFNGSQERHSSASPV